MFLKLEYSELRNALVIKGAENLNTLPEDLFELPLPITSVMTLLADMREVVLDGESMEFKYGNYIVNLLRSVKTSSENSIFIAVEEVKGEMSKYVFNQQFDGYWNGTKSLLTGIREFKGKINNDISQTSNTLEDECSVIRDATPAKRTSLCVLTPDPEPFKYDPVDGVLTIFNNSDISIRMSPDNAIEFMYSIQKITNNRYKPYDGVTANNPEDLRKQLVKENYVKMLGPINCEVWGCFSDSIENLLMLEIIYPYTGSRHINVALDLNLYKTTLSV